ncbi:MAG: sensor histidine kinase [Chloroflexi bacterium]|nr:sensor histidine kinase [Chloroflexota bacterium]
MDNSAQSKTHTWEQWDWVWHTLAYGLMTLDLIIAWDNDARRGSVQVTFWLTVILALWYVPFMALPSTTWKRNVLPAFLYFLLGWLIWMGLIYFHAPAMMLAALFYPQVYMRLPFRWAVIGSIILTVDAFVVGFLLDSPRDAWPTYFLILALVLVSQIIIGAFINALIQQSNQRFELLEQLQQTRADLARAEREAGMLAERQRLAREIHDTLAQDFTSIVMHLNAARLNSAEAGHHIEQAEQTARDGLNEARHLVWALQPERASLAQGIEQLAARFSVETTVSVETAVTGAPRPLRPEKEAALLRVVQEALTNVKKHSRARRVNVTLSYMDDLVALDIVDDGVGFDPSKIVQNIESGFGLKAMRERIEEFDGTLTIESERGVAIGISIPVETK